MAEDAMRFLVRDASGTSALDAATALTAGLAGASVAPTGGTLGLVPDVLASLLPRAILTLSHDPTTTDIAAETIRVVKNTASGRISLWANDGGAMVDLLTFTAV